MDNLGYQLVVFDWEGTLCDTLGHIFELIRNEASSRGLAPPSWEKLRDSIQYGPNLVLKKLYPDLSEDALSIFLNTLQDGFAKSGEQVHLLPGAYDFIQSLHHQGYNLAIASNKGELSLAKAIKASGLDKFIPVVRCSGQTAPKPNPEMLEQILTVYQCAPSNCLMVGDSETDIEMASNLQVDAVGMDMYQQKKLTLEQAGAIIVVDNFADLAKYIDQKES